MIYGDYQGGGFKYFLFSPLVGEDLHFDSYFSKRLKPPTTYESCHSSTMLFRMPEDLTNQEVNQLVHITLVKVARDRKHDQKPQMVLNRKGKPLILREIGW